METTYSKDGKIFYQNLDNKTGRYLPVPKGEKPPKMKLMEGILGVKFEDDYKSKYLSRELGQGRFARRWGVANKSLIFDQGVNARRRSWSVMLELPLLGKAEFSFNVVQHKPKCEICGRNDVTLDRAHWIDASQGGPDAYWNIVSLCPTHHRQVDKDKVPEIILAMKKALLARSIKRLIEVDGKSPDFSDKLLIMTERIIKRSLA